MAAVGQVIRARRWNEEAEGLMRIVQWSELLSPRRATIEVHRVAARKYYCFIYFATKCPATIVIIERLCNNRGSGSIAEGNNISRIRRIISHMVPK